MNSAQLKDAIASGSLLIKADAGRVFNQGQGGNPSPRTGLAIVAALWNQLTLAEQETWNSAAVGFPFKNKYGDIYTGSGYQVFMQLNSNLYTINYPFLRNAPIPNFPVLPVVELVPNQPAELLRFNFVGGIPTEQIVLVYACNQVQRGSIIRKGKRKLLGICGKGKIKNDPPTTEEIIKLLDLQWPGPQGDINASGAYQNLFGQPKPNALIFFEFVPVSMLTGQQGVSTVLPVNIPNYVPTPKVFTYIPGVYQPQIAVNQNWIVAFRADGRNLNGPMILNVPVDPGARFEISRTQDGPWVNHLEVPLNELRQPRQNVFYFKFAIAAPSLVGTAVTISSVGASDVILGFAGQAIDAFITGTPDPFGFGDVYSGIYNEKEMEFDFGGCTGDINIFFSGANSDRIQIKDIITGAWGPLTVYPVSLNQTIPAENLHFRIIPGATGAISGDIHFQAPNGLDTIIPFSATVIDGSITSPQYPNISYGASIASERNDGILEFSAVGLSTQPAIFADGLVNCTIEFSETFAGIYSNPLAIVGVIPPTITSKQIYYSVIPTAIGIWSGNIHIVAGGAPVLDITIDGLAS